MKLNKIEYGKTFTMNLPGTYMRVRAFRGVKVHSGGASRPFNGGGKFLPVADLDTGYVFWMPVHTQCEKI